MSVSLPKWLNIRYQILWEHFYRNEFVREDAVRVLKEKIGDDEETVTNILSELRRRGWLVLKPDPKDARRSIYRLKSSGEVVREILMPKKEEITRSDLEALLKKAADLIRTRVDYKYILILLFLKRISDKWEMEYQQMYKEALESGLSEEEAREEAKNPTWHEYNIPEEYLWENIRKDVANLPEKLSTALKKIAELNPELQGVIDREDFIQFTISRENFEILRQLFELFSEKKLHHVSPDILGDAYEWIIRYFAPSRAKEGEVYTPREVIRLMVEMLDPKPGQSIYDPACGSGGMLIISYNYVKEKYGLEEARKLFLYGQESNLTTYAICKMNLYIHDIRDAHIMHGDTLLYPKFKEDGKLKQFDIVIANPPWNQDGYDEGVLKKGEFWRERYKYGFPPRNTADWAWIQHMLASAKPGGRVAIVIDNGALFRGGKEKTIRSKIIEKDLIETVLLLPEKLFYNTGAPGAIIIFNKNKPSDRKGKILFINASKEYVQHPEVRKLNTLSKENIKKIVKAYREFVNLDGFTKVVDISEIRDNDYNLNVSLYVMPVDDEEEIDIALEWSELKKLEAERQEIEKKLEEYITQITKILGE